MLTRPRRGDVLVGLLVAVPSLVGVFGTGCGGAGMPSPYMVSSANDSAMPTASCRGDPSGLAALPPGTGARGCLGAPEGLVRLEGALREKPDGLYVVLADRTLRIPKDAVVDVDGVKAVRVGAQVDVAGANAGGSFAAAVESPGPVDAGPDHGWWPWSRDDEGCATGTSCVGVVLVCCSNGRVVGSCLGVRDCPVDR